MCKVRQTSKAFVATGSLLANNCRKLLFLRKSSRSFAETLLVELMKLGGV